MTREDYKHQLQIALLSEILTWQNPHENNISYAREIVELAVVAEFGEEKKQMDMAEIKDHLQKSTPIFGDK